MSGLKRPRENNPYPYSGKKYAKYNQAMPTMSGLFNNSFGRSNTKKSYGSSRKAGPYKVLTSNQKHTNPTYPKPECKIYDADHVGISPPASAPANITQNGTVVCINQMVSGSGVQQFTGNQISIKSVAYRFELDLPDTTTDQKPTSGRVILIYDRQPNGTVPAFNVIFSSNSYLSFANVNTRERFVVLRNDQFSLSPNGDQTLFFERFVKVNMTTTFVNGQATAAVPQTGALLLVYIADQTNAVNQPKITGLCRVRYYDN